MTTYCIDTSALIEAWNVRYPISAFPGFWKQLEALVLLGTLIAPVEVFNEVKKNDDDLHGWLKAQKAMFEEMDRDVQIAAANVLRHFPRLVGQRANRTSADPFVIAMAQVKGCYLVTEEKPTGNQNRPNIPDVCAKFTIPVIGLTEMIVAEKWIFR